MPRPRTPTHLKLLSGTAQPCRMNPAEPQLPPELLPCPKRLKGEAAKAWDDLSATLWKMGVLTVADPEALESLAETVAECRELRQAVRKNGRTYETENATGGRMIRANPEVAMLADADRRLLALLSKFGMTPADRSRVSSAPASAPGSAWDDLD